MAKEPNRAAEMAVFVRVVETGGFSGAARELGMSPSAVSKLISRLEQRLGARLLRRSTRRLALTAEGEAFHASVVQILEEIEEAERGVGAARLPAGRIGVSSSASYVTHVLAPTLPEFLDRFPDIAIDLMQTDALSDLVADRTDVAIRAGPLVDSALVARPLGSSALTIVASPGWIERHGMPTSLAELEAHGWLGFAYSRAEGAWLRPSGEPDRVRVSDGEGIRQLALASVAPARLADFTVREDVRSGRLVRLDPGGMRNVTEAFHAVYLGRSATLPERVRVFLDHLGNRAMVE
jgi:DNA-binding transcriptional LysR family regulator